jgi:RNA polymerase sigma factor (sigma-70 family)
MPPPAEGFVARHLVGPALRTQPDGRLVKLVHEGYETAFEEIVRRYGTALRRYAAGIVGGRAEDVTQDAFSKALLALRRDDKEIELRPWLFRIVRNTALNDLRDSPPSPRELAETIAGDGSPAEQLERREELVELIQRLQGLPEPQRAAIVMRELEGLSHEEIAAALGLSGGAARQAIYRARRTLRDGFGMLLPVPLLKALLGATSASPPVEAAAGVAGAGGAGVALKAAAATVLIAGAVGAGVTIDRGHPHDSPTDASAARPRGDASPRVFHGGPPAANQGETTGRERRDDGPGDGTAKHETSRGDEHGERHGGDRGPSTGTGTGGDDGHGSGLGDDGGGSGPSHNGDGGPDGSSSSGPGGGDGGSSSGPGSGDESPSTSTEEDSSSGGGSGSNSGPNSGQESTEQMSGADDFGDSDGAGGFSVQATQP